jgi:hypothetical protein
MYSIVHAITLGFGTVFGSGGFGPSLQSLSPHTMASVFSPNGLALWICKVPRALTASADPIILDMTNIADIRTPTVNKADSVLAIVFFIKSPVYKIRSCVIDQNYSIETDFA